MSTTTVQFDGSTKRSLSQTRPSRPTTPLRSLSRSSQHDGQGAASGLNAEFPLDSLESSFSELADSMADLEANFMHIQIMHESLVRFNENFASFLYGLNMNAFCVDFPEAPLPESFQRVRPEESFSRSGSIDPYREHINDATFLTNETSYTETPLTPSRSTATSSRTPRLTTASARASSGRSIRGSFGRRAGSRAARGSGIPSRARGRDSRLRED
ncbi:MAG: DASH complex subunit dam1 [Trizodia sp. TS-e1964]|nr:MAG: DASH complex subunit dam1 [Trizodia sp. TS-e1964]